MKRSAFATLSLVFLSALLLSCSGEGPLGPGDESYGTIAGRLVLEQPTAPGAASPAAPALSDLTVRAVNEEGESFDGAVDAPGSRMARASSWVPGVVW